jgi:hypothetical protein
MFSKVFTADYQFRIHFSLVQNRALILLHESLTRKFQMIWMDKGSDEKYKSALVQNMSYVRVPSLVRYTNYMQ